MNRKKNWFLGITLLCSVVVYAPSVASEQTVTNSDDSLVDVQEHDELEVLFKQSFEDGAIIEAPRLTPLQKLAQKLGGSLYMAYFYVKEQLEKVLNYVKKRGGRQDRSVVASFDEVK